MTTKFLCRALVLGLAAICLAGCPQTNTPISLNPSPRLFKTLFRYTTGTNTSEIAVADLNGDGLKDLVTANRGSANISVLIGDPAGGYKEKVDYAAGDSPAAIQLIDLNKDGKLDAVVANAGSDDVSVLLGNGDGTFAAQTRLPLLSASLPADLVVTDLNADTKLDIVVACSGNDTVSILYGVGDGTFGLVPTVIQVGHGPRSIAVADLDKNTVPDIITANRDSNAVGILFGQTDFSFAAPVSVSVGVNPRTVRVANLDGDGWPDLVVSNPGSGDMSVVLSDGGGLFKPETRIDVQKLPTRFVLQDFDGDGLVDLAVLLFSDGADGLPLGLAAVLKGDGKGGFGGARYFGVGAGALDIQAVKIDSDSRYDLATTGGSTANIVYGSGSLTFETEERFPVGSLPRAFAADDFNRDGKKDLIVTNLQSNDVSVLLGNGDGTFKPETRVLVSGVPRAIASGLINADNNPDFVVADLGDNRVSVFLGKGDGTFQTERLVPIRASTEQRNSQPRSVALGDMNGDGKLDIVTGNAGTDSVAIALGNGDGTFGAPQEFPAFNFPLDVALRDMNGDGKLDVIVCNGTEPDSQSATAPRVNVIFGNGDGTLDPASRLSYTTGAGPRGMVVGEFTGDSGIDAITVHQDSQQVFLLAGRTGGKLVAGVPVHVGVMPVTVTAGDINRDGKPDIMTTNDTDTISVLLNAGGGNFQLFVDFPVGASPIGGTLVDVNGDNRLDAIVANTTTNDISVLLGAL